MTKVAYLYDPDIGSYYYGVGHPMKPQRMRMTHSLILAYDLYRHMEVYRPHEADPAELMAFHDSDYIAFLSEVTPDNFKVLAANDTKRRRYNLEDPDCPVFDGLFEFQASCAGASIDAANLLNRKECDIAVNWSGGLHHAKRLEASGFCYLNDIVLGIIELLKYHTRVMYIDIDVHHGDGVEEAFFLSNRVMTVSFHKYGDFFPGTGDIHDVGAGPGKYYAVNVPLNDGIDDENFVRLFQTIIPKCVEHFRPEAIVLQCGADSLAGDRLGTFNLSTKGHGACAQFVRSLGVPVMLVGGGGYVVKNVARAWLWETAVALRKEDDLSCQIPVNEYSGYYAPEHHLHVIPDANKPNKNSTEYVNKVVENIFTRLKHLDHSPSVSFSKIPKDFFGGQFDMEDEDELDQINVDWEGGGRVDDENDYWRALRSTRLRRADRPDEFCPEPVLAPKPSPSLSPQKISIMANMLPDDEDGICPHNH